MAQTRDEYNEYLRVYMNNRWDRRRSEAESRLGGRCVFCGTSNGLQFDHIDPTTKLFTIAKGSSFSEERFWREVDKCQLLCRNCHDVKHSAERSVKMRAYNESRAGST